MRSYSSNKGRLAWAVAIAMAVSACPVAGLSSVAPYTAEPPRVGPIVVGLICALVSFASFKNDIPALGVAMLLAVAICGCVVYAKKKAEYALVVVTSGTEVQALRSRDAKLVPRVLKALNEAVEMRG